MCSIRWTFIFDGKLAIAVIPQAVKRASGILPEELDGVSALPPSD